MTGFTDTDLHEIRRDLSYIFEEAASKVTNIDSLLGSVFGYANGTNNASSGLRLVGEAGPELVKFRGGEQVLNTRNTQKALADASGTTINQNVTFNNLQDTTAFAMMNQFKQYNRQLAINGII
jgi:SLT domain-containing protein